MNRQIIYVSGFPKSGTTFLTRLLGDVLNSPTGGCMPPEDKKEVATEGKDRPGPYIVRKGHFVLIDDDTGPVVPRPHRLAWKQLTNEKIVFLVRDPRDICVSGAWHWNKSTSQKAIEQFMDRMFRGDVAKCGRWDEYIRSWNNTLACIGCHTRKLGKSDFVMIRYEDLPTKTNIDDLYLLRKLSHELGCAIADGHIAKCIKRNSFSERKRLLGNDSLELRRNNMRKGIAGDWKNHFTPQMNDRMWSEFGWMMEKLGYAQD